MLIFQILTWREQRFSSVERRSGERSFGTGHWKRGEWFFNFEPDFDYSDGTGLLVRNCVMKYYCEESDLNFTRHPIPSSYHLLPYPL